MSRKYQTEPWTPTPEEEAEAKALEPTSAWMCDLPKDILKHHSGNWIAARDCQIIASAKTYAELMDLLDDEDASSYIVAKLDKGWNIRR